jgi:hypothetical protein
MKVLIRSMVTLVSGVAAFYLVFWVGGGLTFSLDLPNWIIFLGSLLVAAGVAWYVWAHTGSARAGLAGSVLVGAFVVGGIGFSAGFFGPLLFMPSGSANAGPLLGIFITGPWGFLLGAVGGAVHWLARGQRAGRTTFLLVLLLAGPR